MKPISIERSENGFFVIRYFKHNEAVSNFLVESDPEIVLQLLASLMTGEAETKVTITKPKRNFLRRIKG